MLPYVTVRTAEVHMVNQDVVDDSGYSTKLATVNKMHCDYLLSLIDYHRPRRTLQRYKCALL
jgi:hypothetical protein